MLQRNTSNVKQQCLKPVSQAQACFLKADNKKKKLCTTFAEINQLPLQRQMDVVVRIIHESRLLLVQLLYLCSKCTSCLQVGAQAACQTQKEAFAQSIHTFKLHLMS